MSASLICRARPDQELDHAPSTSIRPTKSSPAAVPSSAHPAPIRTRTPRATCPPSARTSRSLGLDAIIAIGGDDTLGVAHRLFKDFGTPVVGVPKTLDNDLMVTDFTFGFDTAINVVTEAVDRIRTTAESHRRVLVVETMGRNAGWIACFAGIAVAADYILVPEVPIDMAHLIEVLQPPASRRQELRHRHRLRRSRVPRKGHRHPRRIARPVRPQPPRRHRPLTSSPTRSKPAPESKPVPWFSATSKRQVVHRIRLRSRPCHQAWPRRQPPRHPP